MALKNIWNTYRNKYIQNVLYYISFKNINYKKKEQKKRS